MRKNYVRLIILSFLLAASVAVFAQTDAEADTKTFTTDEISEILGSVQKHIIKGPNNKSNHCEDTITTPLISGNGHAGVMFDVVVGSADIIVETFWVSMDFSDSVVVYYRSGTFVGNNTSSAGWIYLGGDSTLGTGDGLVAKINVDFALPLTNGNTYGFYVTNLNGGMNYTDGTVVGNPWASNTDLTILEGNGGGYPFNVTFFPRNFNGRIQYCLAPVGVSEVLGEDNVSIYPNPASNELNISLPHLNGAATNVSIYNVIGEIVFKEQIEAVGTTNKFDISNLKTGVYFVKLKSDKSEYSTRLFIN